MRLIPQSVEQLLGTPTCRRLLHEKVHYTCKWRLHRFHTLAPPSSSSSSSSSPHIRHAKDFKRQLHHAQHQPTAHPRAESYNTKVSSLLTALRRNDTFKLYLCLLDLTRGATSDHVLFCHAVQSIPPTTFSEVLRSFDPFHIATHVDSAPGIPISWGAATHTALGELINKWGVKLLYVRIFNRLRLLQLARRQPMSGPDGTPLPPIRPLLHDYVVLIRCAGATSDIKAAKRVWYELGPDGYSLWKHAQLFADFIKARYLTESLYANNDLSRFRARPLDMHRNGATRLSPIQVSELKHLESSLQYGNPHRFGQNIHEIFFAEPLTRLLRRRKPLRRLQRRVVIRHMVPGDEMLLCAMLKANGRQAQLHASNLLLRFWGIDITNFKSEIGNREISGGHDFPPGAALAPTEALLDAVVHCYGGMGEIILAHALVDFISRRWNIAIPDSVWSDLLAFARIHTSDPAATEWRIAQMTRKITNPRMVVQLWGSCTQEPHNFQPAMKDYSALVKSLIRPKQSLFGPLEATRRLTPLYYQTVRQIQDAWAELIMTTQQGVSNHAAYRHYRVLQASKHYMWYCFHYISRQAFKRLKPGRVDDHTAVRLVPNMVAELNPFVTAHIEYHLATGIVELRLHNAPLQTVMSEQTLDQPKTLSDGPVLFANPVENSQSSGKELTNENLKGLADLALSSGALAGGESSAALRGYVDQLLGNDCMEEEDIDEGDEDDRIHVDQSNNQLKHGGHFERKDRGIHPGDSDVVEERGLFGSLRPENDLPDAFKESRHVAHDSIIAKDLNKHAKRKLSSTEGAFAGAFASLHHDGVDTTAAQRSDDWEDVETATSDLKFAQRRSESRQLLDRPAYMLRPRFTAAHGQPSLSLLREDGKEFTGFHQDRMKKHFAAHRIIRAINHAPGVPVDLIGAAASEGQPSQKQLTSHLLRVRM